MRPSFTNLTFQRIIGKEHVLKKVYGLIILTIIFLLAFSIPASALYSLKSVKCVAGKGSAVCHITVNAGKMKLHKTKATVNCTRFVKEFYCEGGQCTHVVKVRGKSGASCILTVTAHGDHATRTFTFK